MLDDPRRNITAGSSYGCGKYCMKQESVFSYQPRIDTTLGELIEIITQIALEAGKSEEEGYALASLAIESILRRNGIRHIKTSACSDDCLV